MTVDSSTIGFGVALCGQSAFSMSQDGAVNTNVTTCFGAVAASALLNEDSTPILNEDSNTILTE